VVRRSDLAGTDHLQYTYVCVAKTARLSTVPMGRTFICVAVRRAREGAMACLSGEVGTCMAMPRPVDAAYLGPDCD
jgi:hypothetical protein